MDDPAWQNDFLRRRQGCLYLLENRQQLAALKRCAVIMDLERTDARCQVDQSRQPSRLESLIKQLDAQAERNVECHRAVFDQDIIITGATIDDGHRAIIVASDDRRTGSRLRRDGRSGHGVAGTGCRREPYFVPGAELADLPEMFLRNHAGADEPAKARAIGAKNDRHVAGEVDRSDCVGIIVNIRRV